MTSSFGTLRAPVRDNRQLILSAQFSGSAETFILTLQHPSSTNKEPNTQFALSNNCTGYTANTKGIHTERQMEILFDEQLKQYGNSQVPSYPEHQMLDDKNNVTISNNLILTNEDYKNDTASLLSSVNEMQSLNENEFNFEKMFDFNPSMIANNKPANNVDATQNNGSGVNFQLQAIHQGFQNNDPNQQLFDNDLSLVNSNNTLVSNNYQAADVNAAAQVNNQNHPNLSDYYNSNKELNDFAWDFNFDTASYNNLHGDSTTLGSSTRESHEFFENLNSMGLEDIGDIDQSRRSRFTSSISNSISSIFKNSSNNKFNLRVINPLSTHRDPKVLVKTLPNLVENVENLSIDHDGDQEMSDASNINHDNSILHSKKKKCLKNSHLKNCNCTNKQPKKNKSLVSTLTNGRIGGDKNEQQEKENIKVEEQQPQLLPQTEFKFDDELTKVISLASLNSSNYNFNESQSETVESCDVDQELVEDPENNSPDYGALFSEINVPSKKRSKSISFRKMTSSNAPTQQQQPLPPRESISSSSSLPTLPEEGSLDKLNFTPQPPADYQPPLHEPTRRGRKPSLAYDATKQFVCTYCSRRFRRQEHLKRHFRSLHTNEKPFNCELCGKKFSRSDNLAQHIKTHGNDEN